MKILRGISNPFGGEHVLATVPPLGPYARAGAQAPALRKRLNFFPQRSLTHTALGDEQRSRSADAMRLGQSVAPGVIDGLELAVEGAMLVLLPGHAIAPDGQDIELAYPLRLPFDAVSVISPRVDAELQSHHSGDMPWKRLSGLQRQATLAQVLAELDGASYLPHAMVLVAVPRTIALDRGDAGGPCANATDAPASLRAAWEDGFQLAWVPWPDDRALPPWSLDATSPDPRFRNRLAYAIFNAERERLSLSAPRSMRQWNARTSLTQAERDELAAQAALDAARAEPWPWESLGVPLSVVAFDAAFQPLFADRASVVRQGGGRRNRSALVPRSGDDVLWQARVSQLLEHLAELPAEQRVTQALQAQFDWLPPAGILPRDMADFTNGRQQFFPPQFDVHAQPIPIDMVDALLAESSAMLPFNLSLRDQVQLLVPVPPRYFDPDLLKLDERIHPLFDLEIARLSAERLQMLTRRDGLRRRNDWLTKAVRGDLPAYPQDDPNALPDESGALHAAAFNRVHQARAAAGQDQSHGFTAAHAPLLFQATDALVVFVRIDAPPAGIGVLPTPDDGASLRPFVWGQAPTTVQGERIADLPVTGQWARLTVPMARAGLAGQKIVGLRFVVYGGTAASQVSWGYAGKAANGFESYWLTDALPPGAQADAPANWVWVAQGEVFSTEGDLAFGLPIEAPGTGQGQDSARPHSRHVTELEKLLASWKAFHAGALTVELGEPADGVRSSTTPPRTVDAGLDELIARLDGRIRAAADHVDFGFLRARTDIFRLRQSVLGVDDAGRFLTSPAAAELVQRNENPAATEKEFSDYFKRLNEKAASPPVFTAPTATPPAARTSAATDATGPAAAAAPGPLAEAAPRSRTRVPASAFPLSSGNATLFGDVGTSRTVSGTVAGTTRLDLGTEKIDGASFADAQAAVPRSGGKDLSQAVLGTQRPAQLSVEAPPAVKDVVGASLIGATYNTVTVAERFTLPASVVTSNTAAKGKNDFVVNGLNALKSSGLVVDDLQVFGYQRPGTGGPAKITAAELLQPGSTIVDPDAAEIGTDLHEAVYFRRGIDAIDNTIRFLRGMELRAEDYRRLQSDAKSARERIRAAAARIQAVLDPLALKLAEVRHDLSVARSLRAEEQARVDALIARRKAILAEQVPYLVFRRPRFTLTLQDVPLLGAQPADVADPVPACRAEAHDAPAELMAMVDSLRDLPVRWLKPISRAFVKLDSVADLQNLVRQSSQRIQTQDSEAIQVVQGRETMTGAMLHNAFERQGRRVAQTRQKAGMELARLDVSSWKQAIEPVQRIATIRDIVQAGSYRRELTLAASGLLDDMAGVASCLHAALCTVPPATRLRWAELFSQLDEATSLRQLTVLPGFGDESLGVDHIAWRQMQRMADWLFTQVANEADAQDAINDLVRVCVLLAAHAPVKRILSARIRRPVPAVVGALLEVQVDPRVVRIGMQVLVHARATQDILARAVVEDLGQDMASARITFAQSGPGLTLTSEMQVQIQSGPALSTPAVQRAEAARAQADAIPVASSAKAAARSAQPATGPAAEKRMAKQVDALRQGAARAARR